MVKIPAKVKKQIVAYISLLKKEYNISLVLLFGSYAKGRARKDSDIDLAIVSSAFASPPSMKLLSHLQELKWGVAPDIEPIAIDMNSYKTASAVDFVGGVILREGIPTHRRGKCLI